MSTKVISYFFPDSDLVHSYTGMVLLCTGAGSAVFFMF